MIQPQFNQYHQLSWEQKSTEIRKILSVIDISTDILVLKFMSKNQEKMKFLKSFKTPKKPNMYFSWW